MPIRFVLSVLLYVLAVSCAAAPPSRVAGPVSLVSLAEELTNRTALARPPDPWFRLRQASSHDRATTDPGNAKTWFANKDSGPFVRIETNGARREWVIMEHEGPGAVVRFWLPLHPPMDDQVIRFYLDGSAEPAIAARFNELLSGRGFVQPPFAFVAWNDDDLRNQQKAPPKTLRGVAGDLYLPIPFAKGCRITLDRPPFYYVAEYRAYAPGTAVETFSMERFAAAKAALDRVGNALLEDPAPRTASRSGGGALAPGAELALELPAEPHTVEELTVTIDPADAPQVLRSVVLTARFDGEETIWCPLGEFFGTGARLHPVRDWFRTVDSNGVLRSRWVMPYGRAAGVALRNLGRRPVRVGLSAAVSPHAWDGGAMLFHATWHGERQIPTRPMSDWNFLTFDGAGRYVGDTLTVFSPAGAWYGEGDEKVYIDGEAFPSFIGTGTEDYYGYAWGMATFFSSPFLSMPHRDFEARDNWRGYTTTSRLRLLDTIPVRSALRFDMEIWNWADTRMDYSVGTFWYAAPGAKHNRAPEPAAAARDLAELPRPRLLPGAVEFEQMKVLSHSDGLKLRTQQNYPFADGGRWSSDRQVFAQAAKPGEFVEFLAAEDVKGPVRLTLHATRSHDYGILRFSANGRRLGAEFDGHAGSAELAAPVDLGTVEPVDGRIVLRVEVVGSNPSSRGARHFFGLDALQVAP